VCSLEISLRGVWSGIVSRIVRRILLLLSMGRRMCFLSDGMGWYSDHAENFGETEPHCMSLTMRRVLASHRARIVSCSQKNPYAPPTHCGLFIWPSLRKLAGPLGWRRGHHQPLQNSATSESCVCDLGAPGSCCRSSHEGTRQRLCAEPSL